MKAVWQGYISFGMVNIPVKLYSATQPKQFSFHMLCGFCHTPLKYLRYCPKCKKEISWQNVVYGFQISKGKWKVFSREQLAKLKPEKSNYLEVLGFSSLSAFDPLHSNKHYYVVPSKQKEKAYFLFKQVLQETAKVAFGRIIMHEKEHLVFIQSYRKGLLLTTLFYPYEVRPIDDLEELKQPVALSKEELSLAKKLVNALTKEPELEKYRDRFEEKLKALVLGKVKPIAKKPKPEKLLKALELSIPKKRKRPR